MSNEITVAELREMLESYGGDCKVRIVHQPNWPLQETLGGLYDPSGNSHECQECGYPEANSLHQQRSEDFDHRFESGAGDESDGETVFLVANGHPSTGSPYGPREAWDGAERSR